MAYFYRLVVSFALAFASITCYAYAPIVVGQSNWSITATGANLGPDLQAGWVARIVGFYGSPNGATCGPVTVSAQGVLTAGCTSTYMSDDVMSTPTFGCPDLSPVVNGQCVCSLPATEVNGVCSAPPAPVATAQSACDTLNAAVEETGGVWSLPAGSVTTRLCQSGFWAQGSMGSIGENGRRYVYGPFSCSGQTCTNTAGNTGATSPTEKNTDSCVKPKVAGTVTVNGVVTTVCYTPVSVTAPPSTTTASGGGSGAAPTSGLGPAAPSSATSATKETTCASGSCTTTTRFSDSTGAEVGSSEETMPQQSFCQENPASPMCVESRFSGGGCGAPDACSGDAIQCAIQAQAKKTACAFESSAAVATEENAYVSARSVTGDQTTGSGINSTVNVSASAFDQTNLLGAETGLSDLTVTVMGRATTLPLSGLNTWFDVLGKLLMGVTAILCMRIVARG